MCCLRASVSVILYRKLLIKVAVFVFRCQERSATLMSAGVAAEKQLDHCDDDDTVLVTVDFHIVRGPGLGFCVGVHVSEEKISEIRLE